MDQSTALNRELSVVSRRALEATVALWLIVAVVLYRSDLTVSSAVLLAVSIALSLLPVVLLPKINLVKVLASRQARKFSTQNHKSYDVNSLDAVSGIYTDQSALIEEAPFSAVEFIIGRQIYTVSDTGSGQYGHIKNQLGRTPSATESSDLKLFLEASHATGCLTGKSEYDHEFKATDYEVIKDSGEDLIIVKKSGQQRLVFVRTSLKTALSHCGEIWDHGHVRPFNSADRGHFTDYSLTQADKARQSSALAYATLPASYELKNLTIAKLSSHLIFQSLISSDLNLTTNVVKDLKLATKSDLTVSILSSYQPNLAKSLAVKAGLSRRLEVIPATELSSLTDQDIRKLLLKGSIFAGLSKAAHQRITALARADDRVLPYPEQNWSKLVSAIQDSRYFYLNVKKALRCFLTTALGLTLLVIFGAVSLTVYHIGPAIVPIQIGLVSLLVLPLPIMALIYDKPAVKYIKEAWRDRLSDIRAAYDLVGFGLLAAIISYGNFLYFFTRNNISPSFIATDTPLYLQATTVTWVTLTVCLGVHLFFERQNTHDKFFTEYVTANKRLLTYLSLSFILILAIIYNPLLAGLAKSAPLGFYDWLTVLVGGGLFFLIRLSQRQTRKHTREVVLKLHSQVHKS